MTLIEVEQMQALCECHECAGMVMDSLNTLMSDIQQLFDLQERLRTGTDCMRSQLILRDGDVSIDMTHLMVGGQVTAAQLIEPLTAGCMSRLTEIAKQWQELQMLGMRAGKIVAEIQTGEEPTTPNRTLVGSLTSKEKATAIAAANPIPRESWDG